MASAGDKIEFQILSANAAACIKSQGILVEEVVNQVRGGSSQGTGQWEVKRIDADGNPVTQNKADYRVHQMANGLWVGGDMAPAG